MSNEHNPPVYVRKETFDEVWNELQRYKAGEPRHISIVSFNEIYDVGILQDRIRELETEVERLKGGRAE